MKKILYIFVLVNLFSDLENQCAAQSPTIIIEYNFDVSFGRRSRDCRGFGICVVMGPITIVLNERKAILTSIREKLCLRVPFILASDYPEQFDQEEFIMEEDFIFPEEFTKMAGLDAPLEIKKGNYLMERNSEGYLIYLE